MFLNEVNASWEQLDFFSYSPYTAFRNTHGGSYGSTRLPSGTQFSFEGLVDLSFILDNLLNLCIVQHSIFQIGLDIDVIYLNMLSDQCTSDMKSTASLFWIQAYMLNVFFSAPFILRIDWLFLTKNAILNNFKRLFWFYTGCLQFGWLPKKSQIYFSKYRDFNLATLICSNSQSICSSQWVFAEVMHGDNLPNHYAAFKRNCFINCFGPLWLITKINEIFMLCL